MRIPKLHKTLNILIRLSIVAASLGFIYWKVFARGEIHGLIQAVESFGSKPFFTQGISLVMLLMLVNWSIESLKWQLLVGRIEKIPFYKALQSVFTGVTISIFTPNRTGEFLGRAFILKYGNPVKAVFLSIFGSISQLLITVVLGMLAVIFVYRNFLPAGTPDTGWVDFGLISGILLFDLLLIAIFTRVPVITRIVRRLVRGQWHKILAYLSAIESISRIEIFKILALSLARYCVFSFQFYLALKAFGISLPLSQAMILIPLIYLSLAVIPTYALSELGVRGSVSLYFIGMFYSESKGIPLTEIQSMAIVLAAGAVWVINLAIPAILGAPFVFNLRFFRR